jgi:chromosome segregation ATPase
VHLNRIAGHKSRDADNSAKIRELEKKIQEADKAQLKCAGAYDAAEDALKIVRKIPTDTEYSSSLSKAIDALKNLYKAASDAESEYASKRNKYEDQIDELE